MCEFPVGGCNFLALSGYKFVDADTLLADFWSDIEAMETLK